MPTVMWMTDQGSLFADPAPDSDPGTWLEAEVARVVFRNEETGFAVLRMAREGQSETWIGVLAHAQEGTRLRAQGAWVPSKYEGQDFKVARATVLRPSSLEGIARFLATCVKGLGPKTAARIVEHFGERTLDVLETTPERLKEIKGLGSKQKIDRIRASLAENAEVQSTLVALQAYGISAALAMKIHKLYGADAASVVQRTPYRLALEVSGIGFKKADEIARAVGIPEDAPERVAAAMLHVLKEESGEGHLYLAEQALFEAVTTLLGGAVGASPGDVLVSLAAAHHVALETTEWGSIVFLTALHVAEVEVATRLRRHLDPIPPLIRRGQARDAIDEMETELGERPPKRPLPEVLEGIVRKASPPLAAAQEDAVHFAASAKVLVITGGPGTGKSFSTKTILSLFEEGNLSVGLAAPTGRAAKRLSEATERPAATIHRLLGWNPKLKEFEYNALRPLPFDAVLVDEMSMTDISLMKHLMAAIDYETRLVLIGDVDQLPSVGPGAVLRDIIRSGVVPTVRLTQIFRQAKGSEIVTAAHAINRGEMPIGSKVRDGEFFFIERTNPKDAAEAIIEVVSKRLPSAFGFSPIHDVQVLAPMYSGDAGVKAMNERLQAVLNPEREGVPTLKKGDRLFRVGDKVMQLRNNYEKEVFNGDVGFITAINVEDKCLTVAFDGFGVEYDTSELDELTLAYACTIHRAQGGQMPAVVIPVLTAHFMMLARNLLYTAVTRAQRVAVLVADPRAVQMALRERGKSERRTRLVERLTQ